MRRTGGVAALLLTVTLLAGACASDEGAAPTGGDAGSGGTTAPADGEAGDAGTPSGTTPEPYTSEVYADDAHWLCKPGIADDVCAGDLSATVVEADGSTTVEEHVPAEDPAIDCFYVYPTISADPTANSDLVPGAEERQAVLNQAARFNEVCRVFAPVYRQNTLASLFGGVESDLPREERAQIAYDDVVDAWRHYLANDNDGRPVALIGHSQGSSMLSRLIAEEIDDDEALRSQLVAAYLLGWTVAVPEGEDVGGTFQNVPLCRADDQTGCVVSYASFRATSPPPEGSFFGRPRGEDGVAACTNPAALAGGSATLHPYFSATSGPFADGVEVTTPFASLPDFLTAECVERNGFTVLEVTIEADPADPRADDIGGDLTPEWGLHLVDANLAMGDLVDLLRSQAAAATGT